MSTVTHTAPDEYGPRWSAAARAIPDATPRHLLCALASRYRDTTNPVVAATPPGYRHALLVRIHTLLAALPAVEPER